MFIADGERLRVTRPEPDVTFEVFDSRFGLQEIRFHIQAIYLKLYCIEFYFYATYKC